MEQNWSYTTHRSPIGETGDYDSFVLFTNGKDCLQTCGDDMDEEQLKQFCELLDLMPDLYSHIKESLEWDYHQLLNEHKTAQKRADELQESLNIMTKGFDGAKEVILNQGEKINQLQAENERLIKENLIMKSALLEIKKIHS